MITVVGNLKGGAGKSTVSFNIGVWLAMTGRSVVAYDLDPQMTLYDVMSIRTEEGYEPLFPVYLPDNQLLQKLPSHNDEVLVDVGSANIDGMKVALSLAQRVLIPVPPSQADIWSTQRFLRIVQEIRGDDLPQLITSINRADTHHAVRESDEAAAALATIPEIQVLNARLAQRTAFRRSFSEGLAVFELEPRGKAAAEMLTMVNLLYKGK